MLAGRSIQTVLIIVAIAFLPRLLLAQDVSLGQKIYQAQCVSCHGTDGNGSSQHKKPLTGDLSVGQLAETIRETMPEDSPGSLSEEQARSVAGYVHNEFYSSVARQRNRPAQLELSRLTVVQYRNAVMDIVQEFQATKDDDNQQGLTGQYYADRTPGNQRRLKQTRIDSRIQFDFGKETPVAELEDPRVFSIRWSGSIVAPETGIYTIEINSPQAIKFYLNSRAPVVDAWVKSTNETHHPIDVFLVGGRAYPILLEYSKAKQGVDDSKKKKNKPPVASANVTLSWKRPNGVLHPIPSRFLRPKQSRTSFVATTPFPPDDRSYGWIRGTSVSKEWDRATTRGAFEISDFVMQRLNRMAKSKTNPELDRKKLQQYCEAFVERAFRRPLTNQSREFINQQFAGATAPDQAVRRIVLYATKSPHFLYRELDDNGQFNVASRMSFGLWNSVPDQELFEAAKTGRLDSPAQLNLQAARMLNDPRATQKLREFVMTWLQVDAEHDLSKDLTKFPGFDRTTIDDMRSSLELFVNDVIESEDADFRDLMSDSNVYLNQRLAKLFEVSLNDSNGFHKYDFDSEQRAGVLTHPYLLAQFAYESESSPIHRGVFLARNVLGIMLRPPPEAFTPLSPELHAELTTRERVSLQTQPAACMSCHQMINPLGFAFENFDAVGKFREQDRGKPIDTRSMFKSGDQSVEIKNGKQLAKFVLNNRDAQAAFCERLFHFLVGQPMAAFGPNTKEDLRRFFVDNEFNIRRLAQQIIVVAAPVERNANAVSRNPNQNE